MSRGSFSECPGSVSGHDGGDVQGLCTWCGRRVNSPVPRPDLGEAYRTELGLAYEYHHNPDYGDDPYDV